MAKRSAQCAVTFFTFLQNFFQKIDFGHFKMSNSQFQKTFQIEKNAFFHLLR